jgi:hypothetical protein
VTRESGIHRECRVHNLLLPEREDPRDSGKLQL